MEYKAPKTYKDWSIMLTGWLTVLFLGLSKMFEIDLTAYVGDVVTFILLTVLMVTGLITVWKNTYGGKKAQKQKKVLKDHNLL